MTKNSIILGSGRSGTSLVANLFARAGYHMGSTLWNRYDESNPNGLFEDIEINRINEDILAPYADELSNTQRVVPYWDRWLLALPVDIQLQNVKENIHDRIVSVVKEKRFCYKDPRFSYTLPVWEPFLDDAAIVCVFRSPQDTVTSMLKEVDKIKALNPDNPSRKNFTFTYDNALSVWQCMYAHILRYYQLSQNKDAWGFVHYAQLLSGEAIHTLEILTGTLFDLSVVDGSLYRSRSNKEVPETCGELYEELCRLSGMSCVKITTETKGGKSDFI